METEYPDNIIDRAIDVWCRALREPTFDNGDKSFIGTMGMSLSTLNAETDAANVPDYAEAIEKFRNLLSARLKFLRDNDGNPRPAKDIAAENEAGEWYVATTYRFDTCLGSDYGPDRLLSEIADLAGIPQSAFSYKSTVWIYEDHVSASFGYGAAFTNHYPLPDGRWLVGKLSGDDMDKVIAAVMAGRLPDLHVEQ